MIENAWNEYRGWAKRARALQQDAAHSNRRAFIVAGLAAVAGCAAGQFGDAGLPGRILAFTAAAAAGLTPVLGRDILNARREAGWIKARAAAEALKSECFRFAAGLDPYAEPDRRMDVFARRRKALAKPATDAGLSPLPDPATDDARRPPVPLALDWYIKNRLHEQRDGFYGKGQTRHERDMTRVRTITLGLSITGVLIGAGAAVFNAATLAPWVSALSAIGGLFIGYGLLDRKQYLAASYATMQAGLNQVEDVAGGDLKKLVKETETLLEAEHADFAARMAKFIPHPPAAPAQPHHG